ncbi:EcsC family protein [Barrientosiimonas marina]|uniref:EcsC family protein n=1 Tax=Lentibacillus kimchii TaxID=1542911 RepID=A0ABW2UW88_9BACI
MDYEALVQQELYEWETKIFRRSSWFKRLSKKTQNKINSKIPDKAHAIITTSIKQMVKATLFGSDLTTTSHYPSEHSLYERDRLLDEKLTAYRRTATAEGAGTGTGGFFLGLADFPMLLQIKMKFLFEAASIYGVETKSYEERLFLLHVFQLAFSSDEKRRETYRIIIDWENQKNGLLDMDWHVFQQEYRDYMDIIKLLQLVPGFGAVFGAYANHNLLDQLGETAKNAYRIRYLERML